MRELTEEELKLAPEWAVKFDFFSDRLVFMSDAVEVTNQTSTFRFIEIDSGDYWVGSDGDYDLCTRLIVKEPFNIKKHDFGDTAWAINGFEEGVGHIDFYNVDTVTDDGYYDSHTLYKEDIIAAAKALCVTGEDLS